MLCWFCCRFLSLRLKPAPHVYVARRLNCRSTLQVVASPSCLDLVRSACDQNLKADCLFAPGRRPLTFQGLFDHIGDVEAQLRAAGIGPGDCVAAALPCGPDAASAFLSFAPSCLYAPLNPHDDEKALEVAFGHLSPASVLLRHGDRGPARAAAERSGLPLIELQSGYEAGRFEIAVPRIGSARQGESGYLLQTSGTTGRPKFVRHTHSTLFHEAQFLIRANGLTPADRCLSVSPLYHSLGLAGSVLIAIASGGSVICTPGFDKAEFFYWIRDFSPTWYAAVPAVQMAIGELAAEHQDILRRHPLRFSRSSGARLPEAVRRRIEEAIHAPIVQAYGMSECPPITVDPIAPARRKPNSVGVTAGSEIEIWNDGGARLGPNETGQIVVRGPNVTPGYYKDAALNEAAFTNGWFRTSDCGYLDEDGFLFLTGRVSAFINRGGEKVAPDEIDEVFSGHPDVAQAVTFAIHDERLGEEIATAIVPRQAGAVTVQQLTRFAAARLAFHKIPRRIFLVSGIPVGRTGKADRTALRTRFDRLPPEDRAVPHVAPRTEMEKQVAAVWAETMRVTDPGIHDNFFDCGGDSLAAAMLLAGLMETLGVEKLTLSVLVEAPTIAELAALLSAPGRRANLLPLRAQGNAAPLFWIDGFAVPSVLQTLDPDRPVFVVPLPNLPHADAARLVDQYAEECCRTLRRCRPRGPYLVAGFCAAAVVAMEVARRLEAEGEAVCVVMFEARGVLRHNTSLLESPWVTTVRAAQNFFYHFKRMLKGGASNALSYGWGRVQTQLGRVRRTLLDCRRRLLISTGGKMPAVLQDGELLFSIALRYHRPKPYLGRIIHIWAEDRPKGWFRDLESEWGPVGTGRTEFYEVPGNHISMFQGGNGMALGRILNQCLIFPSGDN